MGYRSTTIYKKPWAQRFNPPRIDDVARKTYTVRANGVSIEMIAEFIAVMEDNQHVDIIRDQQMLLPVVEDFTIHEMDPAYFMRDGGTINLRFLTRRELLRNGNPQELLYDALRKYSKSNFRSVRGYSWMPYMGGGKSVVYVPSRRTDEEYAVRFYNLPTGENAYAAWSLTSHKTDSIQAVFAGMTELSRLEQVVFGQHQIAA